MCIQCLLVLYAGVHEVCVQIRTSLLTRISVAVRIVAKPLDVSLAKLRPSLNPQEGEGGGWTFRVGQRRKKNRRKVWDHSIFTRHRVAGYQSYSYIPPQRSNELKNLEDVLRLSSFPPEPPPCPRPPTPSLYAVALRVWPGIVSWKGGRVRKHHANPYRAHTGRRGSSNTGQGGLTGSYLFTPGFRRINPKKENKLLGWIVHFQMHLNHYGVVEIGRASCRERV